MLFLNPEIVNIILTNSIIERNEVFDERLKNLNNVELETFISLLLMSGVYKSRNKSTGSFGDAETERNIFRATMSFEKFKMISRVLRFDDRQTRAKR